jgi:periplasmic copper chaperone A
MIFRLNRAELNRSRPSRLQSASAAPCRLTCRGFAAAMPAPLSEFETKKHQVPGEPHDDHHPSIRIEIADHPSGRSLNRGCAVHMGSDSMLHCNPSMPDSCRSTLRIDQSCLWRGGVSITISDAWVHAVDRPGADVALSMTIRNAAEVADALLRVRCPVANFSAKHTVDRGEGSPAMREIPSIPIAAGSTTALRPDTYHVMLVQTRQALAAGEAFNCSIVFQKAGTIETEVKVHGLP